MKKLLFVLLALTACTKVPLLDADGKYLVSFEETGSKTVLCKDGQKVIFSWNNEPQSAMKFIQSAGGTVRLQPSASFSVSADGKARITAEFEKIQGATEYSYAGIYPSSAITEVPTSLSACRLTIPDTQTLSLDTFDPAADLMFSKIVSATSQQTSFSLELHRMVTIGKMSIRNLGLEADEKLLAVEFSSPSATFTGQFEVDIPSAKIVKTVSANSFVRMESQAGIEVNAAEFPVWFACLPCNLQSGSEYRIIVRTDRHIFIKNGRIFSGGLNFNESGLTEFGVDMGGIKACTSLNYEQFGAVGDGGTDDTVAISTTHEYANYYDLPVVISGTGPYLLGKSAKAVVIQTDVNWGQARFIVDDSELSITQLGRLLFNVTSRQARFAVTGISKINKGQPGLGVGLPGRCYVEVVDTTRKIYIRDGAHANSGSNLTEIFICAPDGSFSEKTPSVWQFDNVTSVTADLIPDKTLVIEGGIFTTVANRLQTSDYANRCIRINRSNVLVRNLTHLISGEGDCGAPYHGFINIGAAAEVELKNCSLSGHKYYNNLGSYEISCSKVASIKIDSCKQVNSIFDTSLWGIIGSNFCKDFSIENSSLSRFDAHQGVTGVSLKNSVFGHQGVRCVGFGNLEIESCQIHDLYVIDFRADYGASWEGDVHIKDCDYYPSSDNQPYIIHSYNYGTHDFGYLCTMPRTITIDGLRIHDSDVSVEDYAGPGIFSNVGNRTKAIYPYAAPETVFLSGVVVDSGKPVSTGPSKAFYSNTKIVWK